MTMGIKLNLYRRRDGSFMAFANCSNRVSVGLAPEKPFAPYGKNTTQGQRSLVERMMTALRRDAVAPPAPVDYAAHDEIKFDAGGLFRILVTDVATIGGVTVGADGMYALLPDGRIYDCSEWLRCD